MIEVNKYPELADTTETMRLPLLYTYRRCPYAMRARMALLVAKREFTAVEIVLRDKPAAMLALSPKGTVPVLQLPDGSVLDESWDIMRWALEDTAVCDHAAGADHATPNAALSFNNARRRMRF